MNRLLPYLIFTLTLLLAALPLHAQPTGPEQEALQLAREARESIADGAFQTAAEKFARAAKLCPDNLDYRVGLAHARYFLDDFDGAMTLCQPLLDAKKTTAEAFQVYGNCQDAQGHRYEALETYRKGLKRFPKSGALYMEMGVLEFGRHRDAEALAYWEQGIRVQPTYSSNYFFAARQLLETGDYAWAANYAEQCINLARVGEQVHEMSKLLMVAHERARHFDYAKAFQWRFFQVKDSTTGIPLPSPAYQSLLDQAFASEFMDTTAKISIAKLAEIRRFVCQWLPKQQRKGPAQGLIAWQQAIAKEGHLEAYHYWLLYDARPDEFEEWLLTNQNKLEDFENWLRMNTYAENLKRAVMRPSTAQEARTQ